MVSDRIVDFRFFVKFHRSGPAIIFNFWTLTEQVSYPSKKLLIKQRYIKTSSRWWVLLWKDYGCFLLELSIFNFSSNFTGPELQWFSDFELSRSMLVTGMSRDHFWSICTYPFSTNIGLNGRLLVPNLVDFSQLLWANEFLRILWWNALILLPERIWSL